MVDNCGNCFFGRSPPDDSGMPGGSLCCMRYAPSINPPLNLIRSPTGFPQWPWPIVLPDFWCGDYAAADPNVYPGATGRTANNGLTNYYVRPDGSDANDGSADTPNHAFLTVMGAYNYAAENVDARGQPVVINMAPGTYAGDIYLTQQIMGQDSFNYNDVMGVTLLGSSGVTLTTASGAPTLALRGDVMLAIDGGMNITNTANGHGVDAGEHSLLYVKNVNFGAVGSGNHLVAESGGIIEIIGNYSVSGPAADHWLASNLGRILANGTTVTITGTPAFSDRFVRAANGGLVQAPGMTFTGAATGTRYNAMTGGIIDSGGGGANYFPGNVAGTADASTFGLYL
jgi:hypothetical protein